MEPSTLVPTGAGEQNLTPGEQRILTLLEQGQRRMEQRMQSLEDKLGAQSQQLKELTLKVGHEAGASKMRDRQLAEDLQRLLEEGREREVRLIEYVNRELGTFQQDLQQEVRKLAVALETPVDDRARVKTT